MQHIRKYLESDIGLAGVTTANPSGEPPAPNQSHNLLW